MAKVFFSHLRNLDIVKFVEELFLTVIPIWMIISYHFEKIVFPLFETYQGRINLDKEEDYIRSF